MSESAYSLVAPLVSRPFYDAAFRHAPRWRLAEPLHYRLLKSIDPALHALPFEKGGWPQQNANLLVASRLLERLLLPVTRARKRWNQHQRAADQPHRHVSGWIDDMHANLLQANLATIRQFNLDQVNSPVWDFVDRQEFESLTGNSADLARRKKLANTLLTINTIHFQRQRQLEVGKGASL